MPFRAFFVLITLLLAGPLAHAEERIHSYDVDITVETSGDIIVSETLYLTPENIQINRGIYRALPRYYALDGEEKFRYDYTILDVTRNGSDEPYEAYTEDNAFIIRIGDADRILPYGELQTYNIRYRVRNQIRYFKDHDELYWNVTGSYWDFPIDVARADIHLPEGARITGTNAFTGALGETGRNYEITTEQYGIAFETTQPLYRQQGLTISVSIDKGVIDPPSASDKSAIFWQRYLGLFLLGGSLLGVFFFYYRSWNRVGRDAPRLPVFPVYHPPKGLSPGAAHFIYYRQFKGNDAFSADLVDMAVKGMLNMKPLSKSLTLNKRTPETRPAIADHQSALFESLLGSRESRIIGGSYDSGFASSYTNFKSAITKKYGTSYFRRNTGYLAFAIIASAAMIVLSVSQTLNWTPLHFTLIGGLIAVNLLFLYLMPAQTKKGEKARSEIAGLRLYLETAEKNQMNAVDVHAEAPPPLSKKRYEELLPFAMALDVEKPWSRFFEKVLPDEARTYNPGWNTASHFTSGSLHSMNQSLQGSISTGVTTASVQPSSSSGGSGGGGFSGGGGGGGGGGGW